MRQISRGIRISSAMVVSCMGRWTVVWVDGGEIVTLRRQNGVRANVVHVNDRRIYGAFHDRVAARPAHRSAPGTGPAGAGGRSVAGAAAGPPASSERTRRAG